MRTKLPSFGFKAVQRGRRIAFNDALLQNLGIQEGDQVELFLDTKEEAIVVKKSQNVPSKPKAGRRKASDK